MNHPSERRIAPDDPPTTGTSPMCSRPSPSNRDPVPPLGSGFLPGGGRLPGLRCAGHGRRPAVASFATAGPAPGRRRLRRRRAPRLDQPGVLRWQAAGFVAPFEFPSRRQRHPLAPAGALAQAGRRLLLRAGRRRRRLRVPARPGRRKVELDVPRLGRLHVQRSSIHRIYRWRDSADLIYLGPNGLTGWHEPAARRTGGKNRAS